MADGRKNNKGTKGNKGGSPGFGSMSRIKDYVKKHMPQWWEEWEEIMNSGDIQDKKWAMQEFNKLQTKMTPSTIEDDDGNKLAPVLVTFLKDKE